MEIESEAKAGGAPSGGSKYGRQGQKVGRSRGETRSVVSVDHDDDLRDDVDYQSANDLDGLNVVRGQLNDRYDDDAVPEQSFRFDSDGRS